MTLIALFTNVWPALVGVAAGGGAYLWMDGPRRELRRQQAIDKAIAYAKNTPLPCGCNAIQEPPMTIDCRNCKFWSYDMDMEPFCLHPHANAWGTDINRMRGTIRTPNMRGEPCGPGAKLFEPSNRRAS